MDAADSVRLGQELETRLSVIEGTIHRLAGRVFNIGSTKQLAKCCSTSSSCRCRSAPRRATDRLRGPRAAGEEQRDRGSHPRQDRPARKPISTYTSVLAEAVSPEDGRDPTPPFKRPSGHRAPHHHRPGFAAHAGSNGGGPPHPPSLHRAPGHGVDLRRLEPDSAPHLGPRIRGRGARSARFRSAGTCTVRRPGDLHVVLAGGHARAAGRGQDDRTSRPFYGQGANALGQIRGHPQEGGRAIHRALLRDLRGRPALARPHHRGGDRHRLCHDHPRSPALHPRAQQQEHDGPPGGPAHRGQYADPRPPAAHIAKLAMLSIAETLRRI